MQQLVAHDVAESMVLVVDGDHCEVNLLLVVLDFLRRKDVVLHFINYNPPSFASTF